MAQVKENTEILPEIKDAFWKVVEGCLVQFHGYREDKAHKKSLEFRAGVESPSEESLKSAGLTMEDYMGDLFYRNEPFEVACNLSAKQLKHEEYVSRYEKLLSKHEPFQQEKNRD